jgi:hypothetical protein
MKIGKPAMPTEWNSNATYAEVWSAIAKLPDGKWLPVTFENAKDAMKLFRAAKYHRFPACVRGKTTWVRKGNDDQARPRAPRRA